MTKKRKNATIITRENSGEGAVYGRVCFRRTASVIRGRGDRPRGRGEARLGAGITPRNWAASFGRYRPIRRKVARRSLKV